MDSSPWSRRVPPKPPGGTTVPQPPSGAPKVPPSRENPPSPRGSVGPNNQPPSAVLGQAVSQQPRDAKKPPSDNGVTRRGLLAGGLSLFLIIGVIVFLARRSDAPGESQVSVSSPITEPTTSSTTEPTEGLGGTANWDELARSVVFISAASPCDWRGSGTLVLDGSFVLTNEHVSSDGRCTLTVGLTENLSSEPSGDLNAIVVARSAEDDLAVLRLVDSDGNPIIPAGHKPVSINYLQPPLGSRLTTLGYPALGTFDTGMTITFTSGDFSGIDNTFGEFYKTTAQMRGGVSGGAAFTDDGQFIGVPTAGFIDEVTGEDVGINLIRPAKYAKPLLEEAQKSPLAPVPRDDSDSDNSGGGYDSSGTDPRFGTCKEAKANGYGPYYMGFDPEYDWYRDADSDGVVCE